MDPTRVSVGRCLRSDVGTPRPGAVPPAQDPVLSRLDIDQATRRRRACGRLAQLADGWSEGLGPLSPHVCWVRHGRWRQLTSSEDKTIHVSVDDEVRAEFGLDD